ncbi:hypothetical protein ACFSTA_04240 [Ornithinibacillus salinisoli]|uniref:Uncharacterized protein n=1 Tax=Ornithinibacillus salinisoli TaxID=1848459 RepID=A0ABW4VWV5_9BACI
MKYYGIVTDPEITEVELDVTEGYGWDDVIPEEDIQTLSNPLEDHRMFLFHWNEEKHDYLALTIRGLDENREVIYEEDLR